jgi:long-chain acyl-CoA synthetase
VGEILVRGPNIMKGYYNDPDLTAQTIDQEGWLRTGDLGEFDKDGYLYIRGRLKNMILGPSGENIYPEGIESVLQRSEYVLESLVYKQNNRLVARVHPNYEKLDEELGARGLSQTEIREFVKELLVTLKNETNANVASFSRISEVIEQTEPFEKTPTQKIKRYLYVSEE